MITPALRKFFDRFPDTEGEQATIRAFFCPLVAAAYMYSLPEQDGPWPIDHGLLYWMVVLYAIASALILIALMANRYPLLDDIGLRQVVLERPGPNAGELDLLSATHHYEARLRPVLGCR